MSSPVHSLHRMLDLMTFLLHFEQSQWQTSTKNVLFSLVGLCCELIHTVLYLLHGTRPENFFS